MRLVNTSTLELEEFLGKVPPYAILSHTWEDGEISFQDLHNNARVENKPGYKKIWMSCQLARKDSFKYIWIDTCCINKESSAELSEAINSMYGYYRDSYVCYAYLLDVRKGSDELSLAFRRCKWFTRGWTLQELLAPSSLIFLDMDWEEIGTKSSLQELITIATGIPSQALLNFDFVSFSAAKRMSWASRRCTTRAEDRAYSLMGIFGVNMPALYGEGESNAFMRLQQEIIKNSNDQSIFAWSATVGSTEPRGLFARSPSEFKASGGVTHKQYFQFIYFDDDAGMAKFFSMTNNGLCINLPMQPVLWSGPEMFMALLDCEVESSENRLAVYLQKTNRQQYVRCKSDELVLVSLSSMSKASTKEIYIQEPRSFGRQTTPSGFKVLIKPQPELVHAETWKFSSIDRTSSRLRLRWQGLSDRSSAFVSETEWQALNLQHEPSGAMFLVVVGVHNANFFSDIVVDPDDESPENIFYSYYDGHRVSMRTCNLDRVTRFLSRAQTTVSVEIRRCAGVYLLSIGLVPGRIAETLVPKPPPPTSGFIVQIETDRSCSLKEVYPVQTRRPEEIGPSAMYLSFEDTTSFASSVLVFGSELANFSRKVAVILGIRDGNAWVDVLPVVDDTPAGIDSIWRLHFNEVTGRRKLLEMQSSLSRIVHHEPSFGAVDITVGVSKTLQLGSHWTRINVQADPEPQIYIF